MKPATTFIVQPDILALPPIGEPPLLAEILSRDAAEELRRQPADLSTLYLTGVRLSATLDWEPLLQETLETAIHLTRADGASLMLIDEHRGDLYIAAGRNLPDPIIAKTRVNIGEGVVGWVAQHRQALLLIGPVEIARFPKFFPKPESIGSSICVPLLSPATYQQPEAVLGVLTVSRRVGTPHFTKEDLALLTALSTQAAAALRNARLYQQMQRRATQLQNLVEISRNLAANLDMDVVLRSIMERAVELLRAEAGSLLLVDESTQELIFKVALGPAGARLSNTRLPPGVGIAGAVARDGKPLIVNDVKSDPRHYAGVDASTSLTTHTLVCVPLVSKARVLGVVEVINKLDRTPFDEEDCEMLAAFAVEGAIALENARLYSDLRNAFADTVRVIANAVEARDPYTKGHTERVTHLALETARALGWTRAQMEFLEFGALLHDIGKIGISDTILQKPEGLSEAEYTQMKEHPIVGARILQDVGTLRPIQPYILYHQERYDGKGYPFGLAGKEIPPEGRLLAVVDAFDAMVSDRPYRKAMAVDDALAEIERNSGHQFDPDIVNAFLRVVRAQEGLEGSRRQRRQETA